MRTRGARHHYEEAGQHHGHSTRLEGRKAVLLPSVCGQEEMRVVLSPAGASEAQVNEVLHAILGAAGERGLGWGSFEQSLVEKGFLFLETQDGPVWDRDWDMEAVEAAYEDLPSLAVRADCDPGEAADRILMFLPCEEGHGWAMAVLSPPKAHPALAAKAIAESMAMVDANGDWSWAAFKEGLEAKGFVVPDAMLANIPWDSVVRPPAPSGMRQLMAKGA